MINVTWTLLSKQNLARFHGVRQDSPGPWLLSATPQARSLWDSETVKDPGGDARACLSPPHPGQEPKHHWGSSVLVLHPLTAHHRPPLLTQVQLSCGFLLTPSP